MYLMYFCSCFTFSISAGIFEWGVRRSSFGSLDLILQYQNPLSQFFDEAKLGGSNSNIYVLYVHPENWWRLYAHFDEHIVQMGLVQPPTRKAFQETHAWISGLFGTLHGRLEDFSLYRCVPCKKVSWGNQFLQGARDAYYTKWLASPENLQKQGGQTSCRKSSMWIQGLPI